MHKAKNYLVAVAIAVAAVTASAGAFAIAMVHVGVNKTSLKGPQHFIEPKMKHRALAMKGFDFEFQNGDHKLREIGVWPLNENVHVSFADHNSDDPYKVKATWVQLSLQGTSARHVAKKNDCKGTCNVPLTPPPGSGQSPEPPCGSLGPCNVPPGSDWRLILSGFKLSRVSGDANVKRIAIRPKVSAGHFEVAFHDQGAPQNNAFRVEVTYYYQVAKAFKHYGTTNGHKKGGLKSIALGTTGGPGQPVISGFDFRYSNGDHFLQRFAIETKYSGTSQNFEVTFNDKNLDDAVDAIIDYAIVSDAYLKSNSS